MKRYRLLIPILFIAFEAMFVGQVDAYYGSHLGRFITRDPITHQGGPNFYEYATSRPIILRDPEGLTPNYHLPGPGNGGGGGPIGGPPPGANLPSPIRYCQPGEAYCHYGFGNQAASFQGGIRPGGFATPNSGYTGGQAQQALQLPQGPLRDTCYPVRPEPGTGIIGPRPVAGGSGYEVVFPWGTGPGTVGPGWAIP